MILATILINLTAPIPATAPDAGDLAHAICTAAGMVQTPEDGSDTAPQSATCPFCLPLQHCLSAPVAAVAVVERRLAAPITLVPATTAFRPRPTPSPATPRAPPR